MREVFCLETKHEATIFWNTILQNWCYILYSVGLQCESRLAPSISWDWQIPQQKLLTMEANEITIRPSQVLSLLVCVFYFMPSTINIDLTIFITICSKTIETCRSKSQYTDLYFIGKSLTDDAMGNYLYYYFIIHQLFWGLSNTPD